MSKPRSGAPKRVAVGLLAGALAAFGVALAPNAGATVTVATERLAGATRYGTAQAVSAHASLGKPVYAILATGENYPDALAAASLAGANAPAPIVLTETNTYTAEAKAALLALKAQGVTGVTIVGGTSAVSTTVEDAVKADGFTVVRVAGEDRYSTAAAIAVAANTKSAAANVGTPALKTALIATGTNFPDALAAGSAAYGAKLPLLLVSDEVPTDTLDAISSMAIRKVVILGGTAAISSTLEGQLVVATGNTATRLAGNDRFETAAAVGAYVKGTLGFQASSAVLATGTNFPDALAAGPLAGANRAPIILTASLPAPSKAFCDLNSSTIAKLFVTGGTDAIDDATVTEARLACQNVGNDSGNKSVSSRPELTGAAIVKTVATGFGTPLEPVGTYVRFTFDEALGAGFGATVGGFHVYSATGTQFTDNVGAPANASVIEATASPANTTVLVHFPNVNTAALGASLTKATVEFGAVRDVGGAQNPEGSAPIGTATTTTAVPGTTSAPDLLTVTGFRVGTATATTAVDFNFDQVATVIGTGNFHLISPDSTVTNCTGATTGTGGQNVAGGSGTALITVVCPNLNVTGPNPNGDYFTNGSVARGYVDAAAVQSVAGVPVPNVFQAADAGSPNTVIAAPAANRPDLVSVTTGNAATGTLVFTFDAPLSAATLALFHGYDANAAIVNPAGTLTVSGSTVAIPFASAAVAATVVGGYVDALAVKGQATVAADFNLVDEDGRATTATVVNPGRITGPDLTAVALSTAADSFGATTGFQGAFTFDTTAAPTVLDPARFFLYDNTGRRFQATTCAVATGSTTTVNCTAWRDALTITTVFPSAGLTQAQLLASVVGTTDDAAVTGGTEDAAPTTGGTGTPAV